MDDGTIDGYTKIKTEEITTGAGVESISENTREVKTRWYKDRGRCRNDYIEYESEWAPKDRNKKCKIIPRQYALGKL